MFTRIFDALWRNPSLAARELGRARWVSRSLNPSYNLGRLARWDRQLQARGGLLERRLGRALLQRRGGVGLRLRAADIAGVKLRVGRQRDDRRDQGFEVLLPLVFLGGRASDRAQQGHGKREQREFRKAHGALPCEESKLA